MRVMLLCPSYTVWQDGVLIYEEWKRQGKDVYLVSSAYEILKIRKSMKEIEPDWVFVLGRASVRKEILAELSNTVKILVWDSDTLNAGRREQWRALKGVASIMLSSMVSTTEFCEGFAPKVVWLPSFYDSVYYQPTVGRLEQDVVDVLFVGNATGDKKREDWCRRLNKDFNTKFIGQISGVKSGQAYGWQMANAYASARIAIDIKRVGFDYGEFDTSDRLFKALGCGCFFLTYEVPGIERCFKPGRHFDVYNDTYEGLVGGINKWLYRESKREAVATCGKEIIKRNHLLSTRVQQYWALMERF